MIKKYLVLLDTKLSTVDGKKRDGHQVGIIILLLILFYGDENLLRVMEVIAGMNG